MPTYRPAEHDAASNQGLLSQLVVPRPVAMVTTIDGSGRVNASPFSYFTPITGEPLLLGIVFGRRESDGLEKHSYLNLVTSGEFVVNVCSEHYATDHIETVAREYPPDVDELALVGWTSCPSTVVTPPGIAEAPARLECKLVEQLHLGGSRARVTFVVGEVVSVFLDESIVANPGADKPRIDLASLAPIGRSGSRTFVRCIPEAVYFQQRTPVPMP